VAAAARLAQRRRARTAPARGGCRPLAAQGGGGGQVLAPLASSVGVQLLV